MSFPLRLKALRIEHKLTQEELGTKINVSKVSVSGYESGNRSPDMDTMLRIADVFDVSIDYLMDRSVQRKQPYYARTEKDERDIAKDLDRMLASLESNEALAFNGEPMDEETKRLFAISLENSMRLAKEMTKQKFTPNKYRNEEKS
jgi:transcriptional regulator with XRE-family HTH domain